jgi:hypothetical protein
MIDTHALGWDECERLVQWFAHRMSQETRRELMADLPQLYVKLHPGVDTAAVVDAVRGKIARTEGERHDKMAAELDGVIAKGGEDPYPCGVRPDGTVTK